MCALQVARRYEVSTPQRNCSMSSYKDAATQPRDVEAAEDPAVAEKPVTSSSSEAVGSPQELPNNPPAAAAAAQEEGVDDKEKASSSESVSTTRSLSVQTSAGALARAYTAATWRPALHSTQ